MEFKNGQCFLLVDDVFGLLRQSETIVGVKSSSTSALLLTTVTLEALKTPKLLLCFSNAVDDCNAAENEAQHERIYPGSSPLEAIPHDTGFHTLQNKR